MKARPSHSVKSANAFNLLRAPCVLWIIRATQGEHGGEARPAKRVCHRNAGIGNFPLFQRIRPQRVEHLPELVDFADFNDLHGRHIAEGGVACFEPGGDGVRLDDPGK
jgi:hypothetical protein